MTSAIAVFDVVAPIVAPVLAKPGDVVVVYEDRLAVVRNYAANDGLLAPLIRAGVLARRP